MSNLNNMDFGSESEDGDDFNPAPAVESDDEGGSDAKPATPRANSKPMSRKPSPPAESAPLDDEDDEDNDNVAQNGGLDDDDNDDDEEEDDDDEVVDRPRKRARRDRRNQYIDIEAEVDDEDDEDEGDEEEGGAGFIAEDHPDDLAADLPPGAEADDRGHRELDRKREREQQMDAEKQAEILKERYGRSRREASDVALVPKRLLLPSVDDPNIWGVRCKPGKEREVVFAILKRVEERMFSKNPMPITSAFERGGTAMVGYIYVEARKQTDVLAALDGLMNVYPRTKMVLVSIKEMPDLLRVTKSEELQQGGYVRIKRGKYAGDLAQIDDVESNGLEATLKIVPRLDYGLNDDANGPFDGTADGKRKRVGAFGTGNAATRPPQRLFSENEAKKKHSKFLQSLSTFDRKHWTYMNESYVNGYLIKEFKIQHLETQNVNPTLEEVTRFAAGAEDGTENLDLSALANSLKNNAASDSYLPGDMVEVYEGEQQGVTGKATAVRGDIVSLTVIDGELKGQNIEVPTKGLRKCFKEGDHVKVIGGSRYRDEVGMVVRIKKDSVTVLSDLSMQEITVFSKDLRKASDTGLAGGLGRYDIHDLVQLDPSTVGCVTKVDRESLRVLDQNGSVKTVMPSQISNKIERRRHAVATDRNGSEIRQDDTVRELGGDSKQGVILHIHRSFLFLHNREQTENSGIFVVRATNVATVAAKGGRIAQQPSTGPDLARMNPALQRNGTANGGSMAPPPKSFGRDKALGQTVTIRKGPYKGLLGIVKDTTDFEARIELHTKSKTIQIAKDTLSFKDPLSGNSVDYSTFASRGRGRGMPLAGGYGGATPRNAGWADSGGRTPIAGANGGRTPAWGAAPPRTPAWSGGGGGFGGGKTPRWGGDSGGGKTPAWAADGGRTSYGGGGGGGRTPAWGGDAGNRTSYGGGFSSDYAGSKTPAYDSSSRTPAYNYGSSSNYDPWAKPTDAPTPAAPSAPTPSNPYSVPTPAAAASTPKYSSYGMDAPTPAGAPTPFAGNPETPAWAGDDGDDGPRYDDAPDTP